VDHVEDFYRPNLEKLGYTLELTYRSQKDAVLVGFKHDLFTLLDVEPVDFNDTV